MFQPVGFTGKGETTGVLKDPVQQGGSKNRITHHLCPISDLFVSIENQGGGFVGITDKGKESIGLRP